MERIEKVLLLAVLGVALMIVAVMSFLPEGVDPGKKSSQVAAATGRSDGSSQRPGEPIEPGPRRIEDLIGLGAANPGEVGPRTLTPPAASGQPEASKPEVDTESAPKAPAEATIKNESLDKPAPIDPRPDPRTRVAFQYSRSPDYLEYEVQPGDSLHRIVQRVCGTTDSVDDVLKVNEELRTNPHLIREGYKILIPKSAVRLMAPVVEASSPKPAAPEAKAPETKPAPRGDTGVYTVQAGDTLWKIAVRRRGSKGAQSYVAKIQEDNPAARGTLYPGMKLRLP